MDRCGGTMGWFAMANWPSKLFVYIASLVVVSLMAPMPVAFENAYGERDQVNSPRQTSSLITIEGVEDRGFYNKAVRPKVSVKKGAQVEGEPVVKLNGAPYKPGTPIESEGFYALEVSTHPRGGQEERCVISFAIDRTPPTFSDLNPPDGAVVNSARVLLRFRTSEYFMKSLRVAGKTYELRDGQNPDRFELELQEGPNTLLLEAEDLAGNTGRLSLHIQLKTTPPKVEILSPNEGEVVKDQRISISGRVSPDAISVGTDHAGGNIDGGSFQIHDYWLDEGSNKIRVTAKDAAGNSATVERSVILDTKPPLMVILSPRRGEIVRRDKVSVTVSVTDKSPVRLWVDGVAVESKGDSFTYQVNVGEGWNIVRLRAEDSAGLVSEQAIQVLGARGEFAVEAVEPGIVHGKKGAAVQFKVRFNAPPRAESVTGETFSVTAKGSRLRATISVSGEEAVFIAASPVAVPTEVEIALKDGIVDEAGTPLKPFSTRYPIGRPSGPEDQVEWEGVKVRWLADYSGSVLEGGPGSVPAGALLELRSKKDHCSIISRAKSGPDGSFQIRRPDADWPELELCLKGKIGDAKCQDLQRYADIKGDWKGLGPDGGSIGFKDQRGNRIWSFYFPANKKGDHYNARLHNREERYFFRLPPGFTASENMYIGIMPELDTPVEMVFHTNENPDPSRSYWLVSGESFGEAARGVVPCPLAEMRPVPCPEEPGKTCLITVPGPLPGLGRGASVSVISAPGRWGYLAGMTAIEDDVDGAFVVCPSSPFAAKLKRETGMAWALPVRCEPLGGGFELEIRAAHFPRAIWRGRWDAAPAVGETSFVGLVASGAARPALTAAAPFGAGAFDFKAFRIEDKSVPQLWFEVSFAPVPCIKIRSEAWVTSTRPGDIVKVTCGGASASWPVNCDMGSNRQGSIDITLGGMKGSDSSVPKGMIASLESGGKVVVEFPGDSGELNMAVLDPIPALNISKGLSLRIHSGEPLLIAEPGFGPPGATFNLYGATSRFPKSELLSVDLDGRGGFEIPFSTIVGAGEGDSFFYTVSVEGAESQKPLVLAFSTPLLCLPEADARSWKGTPSVTLVELGEHEREIPVRVGEDIVPMGGQNLTVKPLAALKSGVTYELRVGGLVSLAGVPHSPGTVVRGRFSVSEPEALGEIEMSTGPAALLSGSVIFSASGEGLAAIDLSDPTAPATLSQKLSAEVGIPTALATAEHPTGQQRGSSKLILSAGSGQDSGPAFLNALDPRTLSGCSTGGQGKAVLGHMNLGGKRGEGAGPRYICSSDSKAFVSEPAVGLHVIDLNKLLGGTSKGPSEPLTSFRIGANEVDLKAIRGIAAVSSCPLSGSAYLIGAVEGRGVALWKVEGDSLSPAAWADLPVRAVKCELGRIGIWQPPPGPDGKVRPPLIIIAGGERGLIFYSLRLESTPPELIYEEEVQLPGHCRDFALDADGGRLFAALGEAGVAAVDLGVVAEGFFASKARPEEKAQEPAHDAVSPDVCTISMIAPKDGGSANYCLFSRSGFIAIGESGPRPVVRTIAVSPSPSAEFLAENIRKPGEWRPARYLSAFEGACPRLDLHAPGGAGKDLEARLVLLDRGGAPERPPGPDMWTGQPVPAGTVERKVQLERVSQCPADEDYNLYLQRVDPAAPIKLGMMYDPNQADAANTMISSQGGSLVGEVKLPVWKRREVAWGRECSVTATVTRPFIQWVSDNLVETLIEAEQGLLAPEGWPQPAPGLNELDTGE